MKEKQKCELAKVLEMLPAKTKAVWSKETLKRLQEAIKRIDW